MRPLCYINFANSDDCCCGVEMNPWTLHGFQLHAENNMLPAVAGLRSKDIAAACGGLLCDNYAPPIVCDLPQDVQVDDDGCLIGKAAWWYDPACHETSAGAFGIMVRHLQIDNPRELVGSRSRKARALGCVIDSGLMYGELVVEFVGTSARSVQYLQTETVDRLAALGRCGSCSTAEIWLDCCEAVDGKTSKRTLTGVGEFLPTPLYQDDDEYRAITVCGQVMRFEFAVSATVIETDGIIEGVVDTTPIAVDYPTCTTGQTSIVQQTQQPRGECQADITYNAGTDELSFCLVDCPTFDPATQHLVPRNIARVEADENFACNPAIGIDAYTAGEPFVEPLLDWPWQNYVVDVVAAGDTIPILNKPALQWIRVPNTSFDPTCPDCPDYFRRCAEDAGLTVDVDGNIDVSFLPTSASGLVNYEIGGGPNNQVNNLVDFLECAGVQFTSVAAGTVGNVDTIISGATFTTTEANILFDANGYTQTQVVYEYDPDTGQYQPVFNSDGSVQTETVTVPAGIVVRPIDNGGSNANSVGSSGAIPGITTSLPPEGQESICGSGAPPAHCFPFIEVVPDGTGPCITVTVDGSGDIEMTWPDGTVVDTDTIREDGWRTVRLEWEPCTPSPTEACPEIIPSDATIDVVFDAATSGTASGANFVVGPLFPQGLTGSNFVFGSVTDEGGATAANVDDPVPGEPVTITGPAAAAACEAPCGSVTRRYPLPSTTDCVPCIDDEQQIIVAQASGLGDCEYRPVWSVTAAGSALPYWQAGIAVAPSSVAAPTADTIGRFWCSTKGLTVGTGLGARDRFEYADDKATVRCDGVCVPAGAGWTAPSSAPGETRICGADTAYLIVMLPEGLTEMPEVSFSLEPLAKV